MIPQDKSEAVTRGLREAFGVTEFEDIRAITKGQTSALVFRIVVRGCPLLLRIIGDLPVRMIGATSQFTCMKAAAEAGLAPHVCYSSVDDGISITDFVEEVSFPVNEALVQMPTVLRTVSGRSESPGYVLHVPIARRDCGGRIHPES